MHFAIYFGKDILFFPKSNRKMKRTEMFMLDIKLAYQMTVVVGVELWILVAGRGGVK